MSGGLHSAPKTYGAAGMRASARIQNKPMMQSKKMLRYIALDKGDTVKDLSVKVCRLSSTASPC